MRYLVVNSVTLLGMSTGLLGRSGGRGLIQADGYPFIENRGQLAGPDGRPLRDVYFSFFLPNMKGYVT